MLAALHTATARPWLLRVVLCRMGEIKKAIASQLYDLLNKERLLFVLFYVTFNGGVCMQNVTCDVEGIKRKNCLLIMFVTSRKLQQSSRSSFGGEMLAI